MNGLGIPDITPYQRINRRAEPTQGVLLRWARARGIGIDVDRDFNSSGKSLTTAAAKRIYKALGIPWKGKLKAASKTDGER